MYLRYFFVIKMVCVCILDVCVNLFKVDLCYISVVYEFDNILLFLLFSFFYICMFYLWIYIILLKVKFYYFVCS